MPTAWVSGSIYSRTTEISIIRIHLIYLDTRYGVYMQSPIRSVLIAVMDEVEKVTRLLIIANYDIRPIHAKHGKRGLLVSF